MNKHRRGIFGSDPRRTARSCILLAWFWAISPTAQAAPPKVAVTPLANVTAIQPGQPLEIAFQVDIETGWHTYWKNAGDAGLPPEVNWQLPGGFETTALEHPVPKRHKSPGDIITYVHEGQPIFIATLTPPADLTPGTQVELKGELLLLVCKVRCVRTTKPFSLSLDVVDSSKKVAPANEETFASARRRFPQSLSEAKYVKIRPVVSVDKIRPKDKFKLAVVIDVDRGNHIQSHTPLSAGFIATDVFVEPTNRVQLGRPQFPKHKIRSLPGNLKTAEYGGRVVIRIDGEAEDSLAGDSVRFAGVVRYQACNDKGQCYRPTNVDWELEVPVGKEGDPVQPTSKKYFGAAATPEEPSLMPAEKGDTTITDAAHALIGAEAFGNKGLGGLAPGQQDTGSPSGEQLSIEEAETESTDEEAAAAPEVSASPGQTSSGGGSSSKGIQGFLEKFGMAGLLVGCFLYGLILNATPCVLPLLSIKVLGFVQQAHESRRRTLALGLSFGLGVVLFFVILGFVAAAGKNVLQYPAVVIALGAVVMALALSMLGVYTLKAPDAAAKLEANIKQEGVLASFGKGALAPVLGFACTGPLLAGAFGWATQQEAHIAVVAFLLAGLGMAFPYMLLGANPNWLSFLPKPGNWMITFERIMGFLLLGMVIWLIHPLAQQIGIVGFEWTLGFFVVIAFACWLLGKIDFTMPTQQRWRYRGGAVCTVAVSGFAIYGLILSGGSGEIAWRQWSAEAVEEAVNGGNPVFVDFTAAWCTVCKVNKKLAINTEEVIEKIDRCGVIPFQGDFTSEDGAIAAELEKHDRPGVPLNLVFLPNRPDAPLVLEPTLSKAYLLEQLAQACDPGKGLAFGS